MSPHRHPRYAHVRHSQRTTKRLQVLLCLGALLLAVPALIARAPAEAQDSGGHHASGIKAARVTATSEATTSTTEAAPTTVTTSTPPQTVPSSSTWAAPSTTSAPSTTVTTLPPTTTAPPTTQAPTTTAAPAPAATSNAEHGVASYYNDPHNGCAHKTLPFGTVVHITASNGRTATCVVDDRGPYGAGRILDLDTSIFAQLAPLSAGVVSVTATW